MGGATNLQSQLESELRADRHRLRVPHTRELQQLLYAGRQRAEAFLSPEKTAQSRFLWITRELEKPCCTSLPDNYRKPKLWFNRDVQRFEPVILTIHKLVISDIKVY